MPETESRSSSLLRRFVALIVLLIAGFILLKVVLHVLAGIAFAVVIIGALVAAVWAYTTLRR